MRIDAFDLRARERLLHVLIIVAIGLAAGPDIFAAMEMRILLEILGTALFLTAFASGARLAWEQSLCLLEHALLPAAPAAAFRQGRSCSERSIAAIYILEHLTRWLILPLAVLLIVLWMKAVLHMLAPLGA
jgi:hypothetical protein